VRSSIGQAATRTVPTPRNVTASRGRKAFIGLGCAYGCNILESIIMTRRPPTTETRTVLRTILSAGVLAVLVLACAGAAAGATACTDYRCAQVAEVAV